MSDSVPIGQESSPRATTVSLAFLFMVFLAVAAVLRVPTFSDRVFNTDETYLATQAHVLVDGGRLYVDTVDRKPPIVPYLYTAVFWVTGSDHLGPVRLLAVLAHAVTALLLAAEARRRLRWRYAPVAAGLLYLCSASGFFPTDAQAANFEVFMLPFMTGAVLLGIRRRPAAAGIVLALATLTKQTAAAALLPLGVLAWRSHRWRGVVALGSAFLVPILAASLFFGPHDFFSWVFTSNGGYLDTRGVFGYALRIGVRNTGWFLFGSAALVVALPFAWKYRRQDLDIWLWLLSSVAAVLVGLRFFPHYYLQLVPPLTLLAVRGLDACRFGVRRVAAAMVAVLAVASTAYFVAPAFTFRNTRDTRIALDVARYLNLHTRPDDRVLVWGQAPEVYWASRRRPAIRFATTGFITGTSGSRPPQRVGVRYAAPGAWPDVLEDLAATPPVLIANMSTANQRHAGAYPPRDFPKFEHFLDAGGWHRVATVDGVEILAPSHP